MNHRKRVTSPRPLPVTTHGGGLSNGLRSVNINSSNLISELANQYNQNNDLGVISSWFRKRKHNANEEHLEALLSRVNQVRAHTQCVADFMADLTTQQERFEIEIQKIIEASENELSRQSEEQDTFVVHQESERRRAQAESRNMELEGDKKQAEIDQIKKETEMLELRTRADIAILKAQEQKDITRTKLMKKVVDTIDLNELPDYLRTFVIASIFNPDQPLTNEMQMMEELKEFMLEKEKAEVKIIQAQAKNEKSKTKYEDWIRQQETKDPNV